MGQKPNGVLQIDLRIPICLEKWTLVPEITFSSEGSPRGRRGRPELLVSQGQTKVLQSCPKQQGKPFTNNHAAVSFYIQVSCLPSLGLSFPNVTP